MFLLDTNVVSELRKTVAGRANASVVRWASSVPDQILFLSAVTVMELELGILLMERRDRLQGAMFRQWLDGQVLPTYADRILAVDASVAVRCAGLHVPNRRSERDAMIAATALVYGMTVVTRNVGDFLGTGVPVLNPWEAA